MDHDLRVVSRQTIFELKADWLANLQIVAVDGHDYHVPDVVAPVSASVVVVPSEEKALCCRTCGVASFLSVAELQEHFKGAWHLFNLRLRMAGAGSLQLEEFKAMTIAGDLEEASDSSGEEDDLEAFSLQQGHKKDEEDKNVTTIGSPKILFTCKDGTMFSVWKRVLLPHRQELDPTETIKLIKNVKQTTKWTLLLSAGGHFAGAIFEGPKCICHKTFHRYTVRKKQGGSQSSKDNKSATQPKSAGSSIRRHNETRLKEEIAELLVEWKPHIDGSHLVFYSAPAANRFHFFFQDSPLDKSDKRMRSIPVPTVRPTLIEIKRIHQQLCTIEFVEQQEPQVEGEKSPEIYQTNPELEPETPSIVEEELLQIEEHDSMVDAVKEGDFEQVKLLLSQVYEPPVLSNEAFMTPLFQALISEHWEIAKFLIQERRDLNAQIPSVILWTPLHKAASLGAHDIVLLLLGEGADPTLRGLDGKTPIDVSKSKATKNIFRKFASENPSKWNWDEAKVTLWDEQIEKDKEAKKLEKKKKKKKAQLDRQKQKKITQAAMKEKEAKDKELEKENQELELIEKNRNKNLPVSDRDKRARAAEIRLLQTQNKLRPCDSCQTPLSMVPFERLAFKYCSMKCLTKHKAELPPI